MPQEILFAPSSIRTVAFDDQTSLATIQLDDGRAMVVTVWSNSVVAARLFSDAAQAAKFIEEYDRAPEC